MRSLKSPPTRQTEGNLPEAGQGILDCQVDLLTGELQNRLQELLAGKPVSLAYLYGSIAGGFTTPFSDIDIGLVVDDILPPASSLSLILFLNLAISDLLEYPNIDVRILNEAPIIFCGRVVLDGRLIYARSEIERVNYEVLTRQKYYDYLPIHRQLQEAFFEDIHHRGLYG